MMMDIDRLFGWPQPNRYNNGRPHSRNVNVPFTGQILPVRSSRPYLFDAEISGQNPWRKQYRPHPSCMHEDEYEMLMQRRRMIQAEREKREREEALRHHARVEQQRREQQSKLQARQKQLNNNARKIQRWYRSTAEAKQREAAARTIQNFFTSLISIQRAQQQLRFLKGSRALHQIREKADALKNEYRTRCFTEQLHDDKGRVRRDILAYEEYLTKLMLDIDNMPTYGNTELRSIRKATVTYIQQLLREVDAYKSGTLNISRALKRGGPKYIPPAHSFDSSDGEPMEH